jgi:hypothetical protein
MSDIIACPWCPNPCGSGPRVKSRRASSAASGNHFFVRCPMCFTEGPRSTLSEAEAIARWNRRESIDQHHGITGGDKNG